jgi:hypothetical protein
MILPHLYYLERYRNKGTRTYSNHSDYTEADNAYQPDSDNEKFGLKMIKLPKEWLNLYLANPNPGLADQYIQEDGIYFCIHPQLLLSDNPDPYLQKSLQLDAPLDETPVIASSSTRTLFVLDEQQPHAVKVHFPYKVSRYTRKMRDEVVEQAINVSAELENGIRKMGDDFAFLREVIGVSFKETEPNNDDRGANWGFVIRDMTPFPLVNDNRSLIPGFALYGDDYYQPGTTPLLYQLIGDNDPLQFVLNKIMLPIVRHWIDCFRHFGYMIEPHGQNVLLEVDQSLDIKRIVHRDLSVGIDMRRRRTLGLSSDNLNSYNRMEQSAFQSITYDRFMGNHFFSRLVECCIAKYPQLTKQDFTLPCQQEFARRFPEYRDYFPKNIWYFSELRDQYNKPLYEDTGIAPEWRPVD